jgi:hypothetical protein
MKKSILVLICLILTVGVISCGNTTNNLMAGASPETSAFSFYIYDGGNISCLMLFDSDKSQAVLDELNAVNAKEATGWSLEDAGTPVYGVWMGKADGSGIFAAWSNGYWITQEGKAYAFDFDFEAFRQGHEWDHAITFQSFAGFPCAVFLTQDKNGWNSSLLTPAPDLIPPDGIAMTTESSDNDADAISVKFENNSGEEWAYGEYFRLDVLLNGVWYEIPTMPGHWGFNDIGLSIQSGESQNKTYNIAMYGELPAGTYRIVAYGLSAEFAR